MACYYNMANDKTCLYLLTHIMSISEGSAFPDTVQNYQKHDLKNEIVDALNQKDFYSE